MNLRFSSYGEMNDLVASVLDALPNIVSLKDRQHRSLFINRTFADFMGRRREDVVGKVDHEYLPADEADVYCAVDDAVFESGETWENEECFTTADGRKHTFITRKSLHRDARGRPVLLGVSTEITKRKEAEEVLRRARDELEHGVGARTRELKRRTTGSSPAPHPRRVRGARAQQDARRARPRHRPPHAPAEAEGVRHALRRPGRSRAACAA